jgi:hypothetical protein
MPPRKKGAAKLKKSNKRKAPEPPAAPPATNDGAGPSVAPAAAADAPQAAVEAQEEQENTLDTRRKTALAMLLQLGIPEERAFRALDATAEDHSEEAETWAEEAGVWLAVDNECADESYAMGAAMEISLVEAEERKATEKPPAEQTGKEIVERFSNSELLDAFRRGLRSTNNEENIGTTTTTTAKEKPDELDLAIEVFKHMDDASEIKKAIVDYLLMEQRCKKWYQCSRGYFAHFARKLQIFLEEAKKKQGDTAEELERDNKRARGEEVGPLQKGELGIPDACTLPPSSRMVLTRNSIDLIDILTKELAVLEEAVFKLPENDATGVPAIFAGFANVQDEVVVVDD